jgi:hypothetical protein
VGFRILIDARAAKKFVRLAKLIVQKQANLRFLLEDDGQKLQEAVHVAVSKTG